MLPRFFVYHQEAPEGSDEAARWVEREARLIRIILNPAMMISWLFGIGLALQTGLITQGWFQTKLLVVIGLTAYQSWMTSYSVALAHGERRVSGKKLRLLNEVPGLAAILIVILVIVRPFG
jgi:protoporphyrinogen IX oxidase